jgi:hypothetical protein
MSENGKKGVAISFSVLTLIASAFMSIGAARRELASKEDQSAHNADVVSLQSGLRDMRDTIRAAQADQRIQAVRDSAWRADVIRRLTDISTAVRR